MAVTVEQVYQLLKENYQFKLVTGECGLFNMVQWISVIDNDDIIPYMRPTELAVTTGFAIKQEEDLLKLCIQLNERTVSGLIINLGPYIPEISDTIIQYCEKNNFPLFSLPWEVRLIDIINETDQLMIYHSYMKENVAEIFKDYIFRAELEQERIDELCKNGFGMGEQYQMLVLKYNDAKNMNTLEVPIESLRSDIERRINLYHEPFVILSHFDQLIILIVHKTNEVSQNSICNLFEILLKKYAAHNIYLLVGSENMKFQDMGQYYKKLNSAFLLAKQTKRNILFYEELGIFKLLLSLNGDTVLKEYYESVLGNLIEYDNTNHKDTINYLKKYVMLNGNIQGMAKEYYVHRNTVKYNLKKIEKITGLNLDLWEDRLKIQICLLIHELL